MNHLQPINALISAASESDFPVITRLAKSFDLDCEEMLWNQFIVAKNNNSIIGFGRLRSYTYCTEIATVGIVSEERHKGLGADIIKELIRSGPPEIYVTCVIPEFFGKLGFQTVKEYPSVLQKKVDFCKLYDFSEEQIFVMKRYR
ncbi:MAG: GNAT family N-acetyltransferase [Bacteroidia bacterium]